MTQTTPATSAQWRLVPFEPTTEMIRAIDSVWFSARSRYVAMLAASPSPAAPPASPSGVQEVLRELIDRVHDFGTFAIDADDPVLAWENSVVPALVSARAYLASDATPAPTSGSEDGSAARVLASMAGGKPEDYANITAKPASEPAGVMIEAIVAAIEDQMPATQDMESTSICDALERAIVAIRALSSSAGPAEPVAIGLAERLEKTFVWKKNPNPAAQSWGEGDIVNETEVRAVMTEAAAFLRALYAHPAPATVDMPSEETLRQIVIRAVKEMGPNGGSERASKEIRAALAPATEEKKKDRT